MECQRLRTVSAYIPSYNNEASIAQAIESVRSQTCPVAELFVLDDASTDRTTDIVKSLGVTLVRNTETQGRGAVRAKAINTAQHDLVLTCDANKSLAPDFLEKSLEWLDDKQVAAVHGRLVQSSSQGIAERWRGRHLFKTDSQPHVSHAALHFSAGAVVKKQIVLSVGNYNEARIYSEDKELGTRLLSAGFDVIFDPQLLITATAQNSVIEVLERYWRWHEDIDHQASLRNYLRQIVYSIKVMAIADLRAGDPLSVPISLASPHYQFWKSWRRQQQRRSTTN